MESTPIEVEEIFGDDAHTLEVQVHPMIMVPQTKLAMTIV